MSTFRLSLSFCLLLLPNPAWAETDFFRSLAGEYGVPFNESMDCKANPHRVSFFDNNHRVRFEWRSVILGYDGGWVSFAEYTVQGSNALGIAMALDDESRLTASGAPVVWVMRPVQGFDGYCWGRTDWPDARCIAPHIRCPNAAPTS